MVYGPVLGVLLLLALSCAAAGGGVVAPDPPAMAVRVEAGKIAVRGRVVTVRETIELPIAVPERVRVRNERHVLSETRPGTYSGGTCLAKTLGPVDVYTRLPHAIVAESVRVHSSEDGGTVYAEGRDYFLDSVWGGMSRVETGSIPGDTAVYIDYDVSLERIDAVQVSENGTVTIKQGRSAAVCVEAPAVDAGCVLLASIYIPYRTLAIDTAAIYSVPSTDITWRDFIKTSGRDRLRNTLELLRAGRRVNIVCWGDSVTAGGSASFHDKCYFELFRSRLEAAYPKADIVLTNAGIGGSNTDSRREGFEKEVLDLEPDLITVEYVNDTGMSAEKIASNYAEFISRARQRNPRVEFIILTPHFVMPEMLGNFDKSIPAMRRAAEENGAALGDTTYIWANLRSAGIPYRTLLANGINHPNDLGHEFFAHTLMTLLAP